MSWNIPALSWNRWGCTRQLNFWMHSWNNLFTVSRPMCSSSMTCYPLNSGNASEKAGKTRLKLARLPHHKGLEEFDFTFQPSIDKRQIEELGTLAFVARNENVVFLGPSGVGKTHLSVGLALRALDAGMVVYYTTISRLIADLKKAQT